MQKDFFSFENLSGDYPALRDELRRGTPTAIFGVQSAHKYFLAGLLPYRMVYLCADSQTAERAAEDISAFSGKKCALLCAKDEVLLYQNALSRDALFKRLNALYSFSHGTDILVAEIDAVIQLFPKKIPCISLCVGQEIDFLSLPSKLVAMGYSREYTVENKGSFALRGDILDIFPINAENPCRIDFFGDNVENIKPYELLTGERLSQIQTIDIIAATDIIISEEDKKYVLSEIKKQLKQCPDSNALSRSQVIADDIQGKLENGNVNSFVMPLLENSCDFFSWLNDDTMLVFDECKLLYDKLDGLYKEHEQRYDQLKKSGEVFSFSKLQYVNREDFFSNVTNYRNLALQTFASELHFFTPFKLFNLKCTPIGRYLNSFDSLFSDIESWLKNQYRIIIYCGTSSRAEKLKESLEESYIPLMPLPAQLEQLKGVSVLDDSLEKGLIIHEAKIVIIGSGDLYTKTSQSKRIKRRRNDMFTAPEIGDYAVHEVHGVGKIVGTKKIETTDGTKEYISLEYKGGDTLYVPVEQMDILSKYMGGDSPSLSKIGGAEFERIKERVRASLKKMAFDLKELYAERAKQHGYAFPENKELMEEFETAFPYTETPDQLASIQEVKKDMQSLKVMDRLLCGDVGFGKTEVAFRAIYLCILGGKQAVLMCPSTILSEQHYQTAYKRFSSFGVQVEVLNRFKTPKQQGEILQRLQEGKIDLLIGTHRLLSSDVKFKNLGLLVLDEEQRFGVEHKEKIKHLKQNIDCLTMTATPIPRTLHMSLSGIRDISTIQTPPSSRLPVQTYVTEETEALIRDACIRELSRNGQVFILYNRVESIQTFASKISQIVPEGKICVAHGRMEKEILENNVFRFYEGECNILITTTIIENGIDLPNANTLIVIDADRLGISQLYQLRGRVGRGSRLAHAYFTFKGEKVMTTTAAERLSAIMEFTELGSGYKIAMRDLEIRGAGNVLGAEQHGHMDKVGYELYAKLLKEEMTGEEQTIADLDIKATAYIPESYIESSAGRLDCYKRIAEIKSIEDYKRVCSSIEENYGKLPEATLNLLIIAVLKSYATHFNMRKISVAPKIGMLELPSLQSLSNAKIVGAMDEFKQVVSLNMSKAPVIVFKGGNNQAKIMLQMIKFLKYAISFTA